MPPLFLLSMALLNLLQRKPNTIGILIDPNRGGAQEVKDILHASEVETYYKLWVFENLGHKKERIFEVFPNTPIPVGDSYAVKMKIFKVSHLSAEQGAY